jgi:hypothetical protein
VFEDEDRETCFKTIRDGWWDWFLTLKFPPTPSPKYHAVRYEDPEDAFMEWFDEIQSEHGEGSCLPYVRVIERRENGDVLFHVLLHGVPEGIQRHWRMRWWELSAGAAWDRKLDAGIEKLFAYLFYKVHCDIEYGTFMDAILCKARREADD